MKIGEPATLLRHAVEVGRFEAFRTEDADIGIALIIGENNHDVRQSCGSVEQHRTNKQNTKQAAFHDVSIFRQCTRVGELEIHQRL